MEVFGLVGRPVGHSVSPPMHEAAYAELGMDARYATFEPSAADLEAAIDGARALGIRGLNVTIPYKEAVLPHVEPDPLAARIGAVNTIDFSRETIGSAGSAGQPGDQDLPTGHNTDAAGVTRAFEHHGLTLSGRAVVVGAGGAGRAASFALADEGMTVGIANRTVSRAESLAADVPDASAHDLGDVGSLLADADVLVNATSVGMEASDESPVPADALHADLAVLDAVYDPLETRLLRDAASVGATAIDGAWMLLYQGVEAFEVWTDHDAPVGAMNDALRSALGDT